jgi:acyl carrier protein
MIYGAISVNGRTDRIYHGLRLWFVENVGEALEIDPKDVATEQNLEGLGLDPLQAISIAGYLQDWLGLKLPASLLEDHPTIDSACDFIIAAIPVFQLQKIYAVTSRYVADVRKGTEGARRSTRGGGFIVTAA